MGEEGLLQFLEPELVNIFRPLQAVLAPLCKLRCVFVCGRPAAPPATYACYQAGWLLAATALFAHSLVSAYRYNLFYFYGTIFNNSLYLAVSALSVTQILLSNRRGKIVKLLHEIQDIDRRLRFPRSSCTHASLRRRNVVWATTAVVFHSSYRTFETLSVPFSNSFWPVVLMTSAGLDVDLLSFVSHTRVLCARLEYLNVLLQPDTAGGGDIDLLACYKKILHALKLINNIWSFQLVVLYVSEFVFTIQCCMLILFYYYSTNISNVELKLLVRVLFVGRQLVVLVMPGVCGQRLNTLLDDTGRACGHTDTTHCGREADDTTARRVWSSIVRLQSVQQPGLTAGGPAAPRLDCRWPLAVLSALATTLILILQLTEPGLTAGGYVADHGRIYLLSNSLNWRIACHFCFLNNG